MKEVFLVGAYPNNSTKLATLDKLLRELRKFGLPIVLSSHYLCPLSIQYLCDYYLYDKNNHVDERIRLEHQYEIGGSLEITTPWEEPYHALAGMTAIQNGIDFCKGKFDFVYFQEYDVVLKYPLYLDKVRKNKKPLNFFRWNNEDISVATNVFAMEINRFYDMWCGGIYSGDDYMRAVVRSVEGTDTLQNIIIEKLGRRLIEKNGLLPETHIFSEQEYNDMVISISKHEADSEHENHKIHVCSTSNPDEIILFTIKIKTDRCNASIRSNHYSRDYVLAEGKQIAWFLLKNEGPLEVTVGNVSKKYILGPHNKYNEGTFKFIDGRDIRQGE